MAPALELFGQTRSPNPKFRHPRSVVLRGQRVEEEGRLSVAKIAVATDATDHQACWRHHESSGTPKAAGLIPPEDLRHALHRLPLRCEVTRVLT